MKVVYIVYSTLVVSNEVKEVVASICKELRWVYMVESIFTGCVKEFVILKNIEVFT
jgi:hypothetical protein